MPVRRDAPISTDLDTYAANAAMAIPPLRKSALNSSGNLTDSSTTNGLTFGKHGKLKIQQSSRPLRSRSSSAMSNKSSC